LPRHTTTGHDTLFELGRFDDALAAYDRALTLNPDLAQARSGGGDVLVRLARYNDARAAYDDALARNPELAEAWLGRGTVCTQFRQYSDAFAALDKALALKPDLAQAWAVRGNIFVLLERFDDAYGAYEKALAIEPDSAEAWVGRGTLSNARRDHEKAVMEYSKALQFNPSREFLKGIILHQRMLCCDWNDFDAQVRDVENDINSNKPAAEPFGWQGLATNERSLQRCAQIYNANRYPAEGSKGLRGLFVEDGVKRKIRIGYLSGEFREQATSYLIVGLLESHNKLEFEVFGFDNGWDDGSATRQRIVNALDTLAPIRNLSDASAADLIRKSQIDILVNLNGYFGEERTAVFARRPAPIQVNYLGFPGTLGADYIDYIVADQCVIPLDHRQFYNEKVVYLPWSYQANDSRKIIGQRVPTRADCGLPPNAFVFCCFNNNYKITPSVFDAWMKVLNRVEGAVLWLLSDIPATESNLKKEATSRGIDANRLIFAKRLPLPDHLARHQLADLFVDTLPYNAHTTASDALWSGLPVLTHIGDTFAGRVAASLLTAVNLPELITRSREEYESLAVELAESEAKLHQAEASQKPTYSAIIQYGIIC
jgi:predicted O-linked N-acetylglucosamine transferase (SPINDLY family)